MHHQNRCINITDVIITVNDLVVKGYKNKNINANSGLISLFPHRTS